MKISELRALNDEELRQKEQELRHERLHLRIQQQSGQLEKPSRLRDIRKTIAKIQTLLSERKSKVEA